MSQPLLSVEHVSKTFGHGRGGRGGLGTVRRALGRGDAQGTRPAVDDVSLTLEAGETLGIVGESGSGKTTLARMALRLVRPDAGRVRFGGIDLTNLDESRIRPLRPRMQMIFQSPLASFDPRRRILASLEEPLREHGLGGGDAQRRRLIGGLLETCGLDQSVLGRRPRELSGGQLQRLSIVRAVSMGPDLIVADEMVSALDVLVQAQVLDLFERLCRQRGMALLFVSHDLAVVRRMSDRIVVMRAGRMVDEGTRGHIFGSSRCEYTRQLVEAIPTLPEAR